MSAADVETQSQQETTNGTSKFDVPEIELIIKVGNTIYTTPHTHTHTHTRAYDIPTVYVCVCIRFLYARFANFLCAAQ